MGIDAGINADICADYANATMLTGTAGGSQKYVEIGQLAALALISHPDSFLRVPASRAVEEEEDIVVGVVGIADILRVQLVDSRLSQMHERLVCKRSDS